MGGMSEQREKGVLSLRIAEPEDDAAAQRLFAEAFAPHVGALGYRPSPMDRSFIAALEARLAIAADWRINESGDVETIGFAMLSATPRQLYVEALAVDPAHQGNGVGRAILARVERLASDLCIDCVRLDTDPTLERQVRFYVDAGYVPIRDFAAGAGRRLRFSKQLATALDRLIAQGRS